MRLALFLMPAVMLALTLLPAGASAADTEVVERQSYGEAMRWYRERAEAGDPKAQFYYGLALENGAQGKLDPEAAVGWYARAAAGGHAMAQFKLGLIRQFGTVGTPDLAEARRLYGLAAAQGLTEAGYNLAVMLEDGTGGPVDRARARELFEATARAGFGLAFLHLARMAGDGDDPDLVRSLAWAMLAERAGVAAAEAFDDTLRPSLSPEQVRQAEDLASAWR